MQGIPRNIVKSHLLLHACLSRPVVSDPPSSQLRLNCDIRQQDHPAGTNTAGGGSEGRKRFSLIGWTDTVVKVKEKDRERETTQGKSALSTHKQIHHQL